MLRIISSLKCWTTMVIKLTMCVCVCVCACVYVQTYMNIHPWLLVFNNKYWVELWSRVWKRLLNNVHVNLWHTMHRPKCFNCLILFNPQNISFDIKFQIPTEHSENTGFLPPPVILCKAFTSCLSKSRVLLCSRRGLPALLN